MLTGLPGRSACALGAKGKDEDQGVLPSRSPQTSREEGASTNPHEFKTGHGGVSGFPARKVNRSKIKTKRGEAIAGLSSTKLYKLVTQRSYVSNPSLRKP